MIVRKRWRAGSFVRRRVRYSNDLGTTMMELVVGMTLMGVFMTMFAAAIGMMYNSANKTESLNETSSQLNVVFNRLDTSVRYASAISTPGQSGGNWYVELQTTNTGSTVCTQLRLNTDAKQLQQRTWTEPIATSSGRPTDWVPLASNITVGDAVPFELTPASGIVNFQQLRFRMASESGTNRSATTSLSDVTFTALNSTLNTPTTGICAGAARS